MWPGHSRYRRVIPIYLGTIVLPVVVLLWLGLRSFERERQVVATLTAEKLEQYLESELADAASVALVDRAGPVARHFFVVESGVVTTPALHSPLPVPAPEAFVEAERLELASNQLDAALAAYRRLAAVRNLEPLALSRIARVLEKIGRDAEAKTTRRQLARTFPDERDLAGRPYGIVAALNAGEVEGLAAAITSGRWALARDQAEYFLAQLPTHPDAPRYLAQFRFAEELAHQFRPQRALRAGEVASYTFGGHRVMYRESGTDRIEGLLVDPQWVQETRSRLAASLRLDRGQRREIWMYAGAVAVIFVVLVAGVSLLWRDVSREARLNQLRSDLVNGVSHELKTPITLVRLYGETLLRHRDLPVAEQREFYRIITRESSRLGRLVDDVLAYSRIERGQDQYDMKEGDVAAVVAGVVDDYGEWLEHAGFVISRAIPDGLPLVRFDVAAVSQALVNLLDNAAKYSGASRQIVVRVGAAEGWLQCEVVDQGIGLAPADQALVFDRFYRAPGASGKGGYGIGLSIVRRIMDAHGGRAEVESRPGHGSTFRLLFPVSS